MAAMTSFHAELCCCLVNAYTASSQHLCSSARQFLIYSTFVLVAVDWMSEKSPGLYITCCSHFDIRDLSLLTSGDRPYSWAMVERR